MPDDSGTEKNLTNADIASRLLSLAQLLSAQRENPYRIRAYRRAAKTILNLAESVEDLVWSDVDLTTYAGIGKTISDAIREIVETGGDFRKLADQRAITTPEIAEMSEHPLLDPRRAARIYRKLGIHSINELRERLASGDIAAHFGHRMDQHVRQALTDDKQILLYDAHQTVSTLREFLLAKCGATRAEPAGAYRRRVEVLDELVFLVDAADFAEVVGRLGRFGGRSTVLQPDSTTAVITLPSGIPVRILRSTAGGWGLSMLMATGSGEHIRKLEAMPPGLSQLRQEGADFQTEAAVYRNLRLAFIPPELREGADEVERAAEGRLPELVAVEDIRGDLHAHTTASDGAHSMEKMAEAARQRGYEYLGITDHSQSLTIARGVSERDLWAQIRLINQWNERGDGGIRILKSAEVDILPDGSLDYPDALLRELDYTICSIHSQFGLGRDAQTERVLRAMDHPRFHILGHATGRLLLTRPGYDLDMERIVRHARANGCFFEINSSPKRLDLSATHARMACDAGVLIAINTDAHSLQELEFITAGVEQARRAGLSPQSVLNHLSWSELQRRLRR